VGIASWYGSDFHKKQTANGGTFDRNSLTAAHKTLPLPSMARITNLENGKTLIVMVNDRGPFSGERIIDMSERAAEVLGFKQKGVAKVRVQYLPGQTKRLLADLPGAKNAAGKLAKAADNLEVTQAVTDHEYLGSSGYSKSKDSMKMPVVAAAPAAIAANVAFNAAKPSITHGKTTKSSAPAKRNTNHTNPAQNIAVTAPVIDNDSEAFADGSEEAALSDTAPAAAKQPAEKVETISQDVHYIQAGTYGVIGNAKRAEKALIPIGTVNISEIKVNNKLLYKVKIGPILDIKIAELALKKVITLGHPDAMLVKEVAVAATTAEVE
jgi:rare lipoprotein A